MSRPSEIVAPQLLRSWGLPDPGDSKKTRGQVVVVGGSRRTPGAVALAGEAALRVGAGRLGLLVPVTIESPLGLVIPEAAVHLLPEDSASPLASTARGAVIDADAVLVGPGFDDPDETSRTLLAVADCDVRCLILDAFALGVLPDIPRRALPDRLVLTPNEEEAALLLGRPLTDDRSADVAELAQRYDAAVACYGDVAEPSGERWRVTAGGPGLGTSGSGDVLAGAVAGLAARGLDPARAGVWATWAHARAGDRLTARLGIGFLARDLVRELTPALNETDGASDGPPAG